MRSSRVLAALMLADAATTYLGFRLLGAREGNPLLARAMSAVGTVPALAGKALLGACLAGLMGALVARGRRRAICRALLLAAVGLMTLVVSSNLSLVLWRRPLL